MVFNYTTEQGQTDTRHGDNDSKWDTIYWGGEAEDLSQETVNLSQDSKGYPEFADVSNIYIMCA